MTPRNLIGRRSPAACPGRRKFGRFETLEQRTVLSLTPFVPGGGELVLSGDSLYFVNDEEQQGYGQLWKTDGTLEGTMAGHSSAPLF